MHARLVGTDLNWAHLQGANLTYARLYDASLVHANLCQADLSGADLTRAGLQFANCVEANFEGAQLVRTNLTSADLSSARVYGIAAWDVIAVSCEQTNLVITPEGQPTITVDQLEVAQFVYLLLRNEKLRDVIDTIGRKGVLILGRFSSERKPVLDALRNGLRGAGFVPMMFDFERPVQRDFTETIKTLAGLSRFIIADITNPGSSPLELQATMPDYMIPFVPIIADGEKPFAMFRDLKQKYGEWVLDLLT